MAFESGSIQPHVRTSGDDGDEFSYAKFRALFDHPLKAIELNECREDSDLRAEAARRQFLRENELDCVFAEIFDSGEIDVLAV